MSLRVKVAYPRINMKATTADIHKRMTKFLIDKALKTWVLHTNEPIPVWSGAARASFLKLAAIAKTTIMINPVVASRIPLGIEQSTGEVIAKPGKEYGWLWSSDLAHIGIVEQRVSFIAAGTRAVARLKLQLPQPTTKPTKPTKPTK
jgi:hypothetical protein